MMTPSTILSIEVWSEDAPSTIPQLTPGQYVHAVGVPEIALDAEGEELHNRLSEVQETIRLDVAEATTRISKATLSKMEPRPGIADYHGAAGRGRVRWFTESGGSSLVLACHCPDIGTYLASRVISTGSDCNLGFVPAAGNDRQFGSCEDGEWLNYCHR